GLFRADEDARAAARVVAGEVHPTAPLPGVDGLQADGECAALEQQVVSAYAHEISVLCAEGVDGMRRATRLPVRDLQWHRDGDALHLQFRLPAGAFATTVLAELVDTRTRHADNSTDSEALPA